MKKLLVIFLLVLMIGCAKKQTVTPDGTPPPEGVQVEEEFVEEIIISDVEENIEESDIISQEILSVFEDVLFDFDDYTIKPQARVALDKVADFLYKNKEIKVAIEGHCDDRGTNEYNLALGEKRAKAAQGYLSSLGVLASRMSVQTYGEEKPLCTEQEESCWQRNRRAHFALFR